MHLDNTYCKLFTYTKFKSAFFFPWKTTECKSGSSIRLNISCSSKNEEEEKAQVNKTLKLFSFESKL